MTEVFRFITWDDVRDAMESLITLRLSDDELAERGIRLDDHETLRDGLGPSSYALIELASGTQYLLERLDYDPDILWVVAPLIDDPAPLIAAFQDALYVPTERLNWSASDDFWNEARAHYDRDHWLARRARFREHS